MEMSAAEHNKCVSIFENDKEEMNEHPLALENGNADKNVSLQIFYILDGITGVSSGLMWNEKDGQSM